jgi:DNA-binding transcriptional LysR family regulator
LTHKRERTLADYAAQRWILPGREELVRQRLARVFAQAGLPEPVLSLETDSLSLKLATLRTTDCLGLTTTQILNSMTEASDVIPIDHEQLQFRREAGIVIRRHIDLSPSVKLVVAELRKIAVKCGPN